MSDYARETGIRHGWDAANYAQAYGKTESRMDEAQRRARDYYDTAGDIASYADGFLAGWVRFDADQWQDGSPMDTDED